jgi:hypothetical protein
MYARIFRATREFKTFPPCPFLSEQTRQKSFCASLGSTTNSSPFFTFRQTSALCFPSSPTLRAWSTFPPQSSTCSFIQKFTRTWLPLFPQSWSRSTISTCDHWPRQSPRRSPFLFSAATSDRAGLGRLPSAWTRPNRTSGQRPSTCAQPPETSLAKPGRTRLNSLRNSCSQRRPSCFRSHSDCLTTTLSWLQRPEPNLSILP